MPNKKLNPKLLWVLFEGVLAPSLGLTILDRAVYSYLLRHTLVVGTPRLHFAVTALARALGVSAGRTRESVRRLDELGALHVLERGKTGHLAEMRLPENVLAIRSRGNGASSVGRGLLYQQHAGAVEKHSVANIETGDFWKTWVLRKAIHDREGGTCFYCLRRTLSNMRCLDHVVPRVRNGRNSYRNLVSCCIECNTGKCDRSAADFLRVLYRKGRLTAAELDGRLLALKDLAAGKLRPAGF
jgi:5-methylcytosine-specific restriction endonuclease McrA